jgi:tetratricopeptide (TPR) repeat protein
MRIEKMVAVFALWVGLLTGVGSAFGTGGDSAAANLEKLQEQVRVLDKDVLVLKEVSASKLDAQDKRISDIGLATAQQSNHLSAISNQTGMVGSQIGWTSVGVTVLVFVGGLFAFWSVTTRAEIEARAASTAWFKENAIALHKEIDQLREQAAKAVEGISQHQAGVAASADAAKRSIAKHANSILTQNAADGDNPHRVDPAAEQAVTRVSDELKEKPEAEFTSQDHFARGLSQFAKGNHLSALESFRAASQLAPETVLNDELVRYLFAQGVALGMLGKPEEEIAIYDELLSRFGTDESPGVREQVAKGLLSKGITLGKMSKPEEATPIYDELFVRFGKDESPGVSEQVVMAHNSLAFGQIVHAKQHWQHADRKALLFKAAIKALASALQMCAEDRRAMVAGNLSYALFLSGE